VLAVLGLLVYAFFLRTPPAPPQPDAVSVSGSYVWSGTGPDGTSREQGEFQALTGGDAAGIGSRETADGTERLRSTYVAPLRLETTIRSRAGATVVRRRTGVWPPAWLVATRSPLDYAGQAAVVRSAVDGRERYVGVRQFEADGRRVWRAAITFPDWTAELVVDQQTGIVTWYSGYRPQTQRRREQFTLSAVTYDRASSSAAASAPATAGPPTATADRYHGDAAAAFTAADIAPLTTTLLPDGFTLVATAAREASLLELAGAEAAQGGGRAQPLDVVEQLYLRRLVMATVAVAALRGDDEAYPELLTYASGRLGYEVAPLQYGAFAGRDAHTWYDLGGPVLAVADARRVVVIAGGLTRSELLSCAEGLEAAAASPPAASSAP
jgi:hypothetical protein